MKSETTADIEWIDADGRKPPARRIVWTLSKYGVASKGEFTTGFHVAWLPLPKISPALHQKMRCPNNGRD